MASVITHAVVGATAAYILQPLFPSGTKAKKWYYILAALLAMLPDADALGYALGVPYESLWGHRGITHSLLFALVAGAVVAWLFVRLASLSRLFMLHCWMIFSFSIASHGLLDACTTGGLGIAFFAPFKETRYFFPAEVRLIRVSPIGVTSFFSTWGLNVIRSEAVWVWLPCLFLFSIIRRERRRHAAV